MPDRQRTTAILRLAALGLGVLVLTAPAAFGCSSLDAGSCECPAGQMAQSTDSSCGIQMSSVCAALTSASEPLRASSLETGEPLVALDLASGARLAETKIPDRRSAATDVLRLRCVERYSLFSSLLL